MKTALAALLAILVAAGGLVPVRQPAAGGQNVYITLASTTSTQNSGLFAHILPIFTAATGIEVRVIAVGTGAAIRLARNGDADVLLVHHKRSEERFVTDGYGVKRHSLMYNDFVIVGPRSDPAGLRRASRAGDALRRIRDRQAPFVSRGDDSGTHRRELELWGAVGIDPRAASGTWYRETGSGMGATLNTAAAMDAYTFSDRGTWLSFRNKQGLTLVFEGDPDLFNEYGVILVARQKHPHVKHREGQRFIDWLRSPEGRRAIETHRIGGRQLFHPLP